MNILLTGGLGYIGSHTAVELIKSNHNLIIVDNLVNSRIEVLNSISKLSGQKPQYHQIDMTDETKLEELFTACHIDGVMHFAGLKSVGESIARPIEYYYNNLVSTMLLSKMCIKYGVSKFIFSSSAAVYGNQSSPLREDMELKAVTNPYGATKFMCERILADIAYANKAFSVGILRYFNPIGAHESRLLGESPVVVPNNLMPYLTRVARGEVDKLRVFGNDYDTVDGTGVRDYIHVVDLAKGHVAALEKLKPGINIYNLGTGKGTSVLELINAFIIVNKIEIPYEIIDRRAGDIGVCFADVTKAKTELGWQAELDIEDMVRDTWNFEVNSKMVQF